MSHASTATAPTAEARAARLVRLRMAGLGAVSMLIIQFIVGMIYNLYGTAPTASRSIGLFSSPVIGLHVVLGILLFIAAAVLVVRAIAARHALAIWMSALGLVSVVGAGLAGLGFAGSGAASASLGMSIAFAVALACYVVLVVALPAGQPPRQP
ncbi:MAG: hypothetical protein JO132_10745 [Streptosporangiaceae bacterium]|nr:hypothetical protein [Streptosporangiaceae bacterium]